MYRMANVAPKVGEVLKGTYRLHRKIGEGGMGAVYEARHARLPRSFAVKFLLAQADDDDLERFKREAHVTGSLGHDNIVQVIDFDRSESGVPFMVLEMLDGEDLAHLLAREGKLSLERAVEVVFQAASALDAAHAKGIVHRDLKPSNLFVCNRPGSGTRIKILDFGISKISHSGSLATQTGALLGTPSYMAPEQASGHPGRVDQRTDVFALAAILYECLTGRRAFKGDSVMSTLYQVCTQEPEPIRVYTPEVSEEVEDIVRRAMTKDMESRTPTVVEMRDSLLVACPRAISQRYVQRSAVDLRPRPHSGVSARVSSEERVDDAIGAEPTEVDLSAPLASPAPKRARRVFAVVAALCVIALAVVAARTLGSSATASSAAAMSSEVSPDAQVGTVDAGGTVVAPRAKPAPSSVAAAASTPTVDVQLQITPADAVVKLDGLVIERRALTLAKSATARHLQISSRGFKPQTVRFVPEADGKVVVALKRQRRRTPRKKRPSRIGGGFLD